MAEAVVFNRHRPPILPLELPDEARTILHIQPPTVELQEELRANKSYLSSLMSKDDDEVVAGLYDLAARLMSCNRNMKKITAEQLAKQYHLDTEDLVVFYQAYANYLTEIENAKN